MLPPDLLKIAIAGTHRLDGKTTYHKYLEPLGIPDDTPDVALTALSIGYLAGKTLGQLPQLPALPPPANPETWATCPPAAHDIVKKIVCNPEWKVLLPEFLDKCCQHKRLCPPALLPALSEFLKNNAENFEKWQPAFGNRGIWLSQQHPEWAELYSPKTFDWATGTSKERLAFFKKMRQTDPAAAVTLLEKDWKSESLEQKKNFLALLSQNAGPYDLPLLQEIISKEKRIPLRKKAAALAAKIPSDFQNILHEFYREKVFPALQNPDYQAYLAQKLPEMDAPDAALLLPLLPTGAVPNTWRWQIAALVFELLPMPLLSDSPTNLIRLLTQKHLPIEYVSHYLWGAIEQQHLPTLLTSFDYLKNNLEHSLWHDPLTADLLAALPLADWQRLLPDLFDSGELLDAPKSQMLVHLAQTSRPWTPPMMVGFFRQLDQLRKIREVWELPQQQWKSVLRKLAYCCVPEDAAIARNFFFAEKMGRNEWAADGVAFFRTIDLRLKIAALFA